MKTTIKNENNEMVVCFEGRLDTAASSDVERDLQPLVDCTGHDIMFDCTRLEYISSSGLRILLGVLKNAKPKGSHVYVHGLNDDIRQVFDMTGFTNLFEFK